MNRYLRTAVAAAVVLSAAASIRGRAFMQGASPVGDEGRHFDARVDRNRGFKVARAAARTQALERLAAAVPELAFEDDPATGVTRSLSSHRGYLTASAAGSPMDIALAFVRENREALGLEEQDLHGLQVTDIVPTTITGATHLYFGQRHAEIPVYNAQLHVNVNRDGRVISVNNSFLPGLARSVRAVRPTLALSEAVERARGFAAARATKAPAGGRLMLLPIRQGEARLVWNFQMGTTDDEHEWDWNIDASTGETWTRFDWVSGDQYRVYRMPAESPSHVSPAPPADGRVLVLNPANTTASPFGWHDTNGVAGAESTTTQGNNVHAYTDTNADNVADTGSSPSGGTGLNFDFTLDLTQAPSTYRPAAVANLFYWNNIIHDVQYRYGFDERAGNFQVNNYGRGGLGNDSVRAEAQDGAGTNNANFFTPADGSRPRMQMFVWTAPTPDRDGDVDNGIVIHEYGHGISNRLVGGPSNVSCLTNRQQPGEGLSDWWTLAYTHEVGDSGTDARGIGTYALNQPTSGAGIRTQRYSTNPAVNTWTYASINGMAVPHGVGSVWAQAAWEVYWKLVDHWGFDPNLYNATGSAGNQRMMLYVNEGLKNTACSPTFTQVRDGIIQAAVDNHGGEDVCRMWEAFAAFGLGTNAVSGGSASTTPTNGFNVPASCQGGGTPTPTPTPSPTPTPTPTGIAPTPTPTPTPDGGFVEITPAGAMVTASTHDGNLPSNTVDNLLSTRWSANGDGQWLRFDLGSIRRVSHVRIAVYNGNARQARFDLQRSDDGATWINILTGAITSGTTTAEETHEFPDVDARYVRYLGHMNTVNTFNSLTEVSLFSPAGTATPTPTPTPGSSIVFEDNFETSLGWTANPNGTDTATTGRWERGDPEATSDAGGAKQLGTTASGVNDLVTGRLAGLSVGEHDMDGGATSIQSPLITLPAAGPLTLTFNSYLAHATNASSADYLRVQVVAGATVTTVFERLGSATNVNAAWTPASASLNAFAGQTVRLRIEAADASTGSLIEAAVDDVKITN